MLIVKNDLEMTKVIQYYQLRKKMADKVALDRKKY